MTYPRNAVWHCYKYACAASLITASGAFDVIACLQPITDAMHATTTHAAYFLPSLASFAPERLLARSEWWAGPAH